MLDIDFDSSVSVTLTIDGKRMFDTARSLVKCLVPAKYRMWRYELVDRLRYYPELLFSLGNRFECPFCQSHFRRFRSAGFDYPVLKEGLVVGASKHANDVCPRCMSNARERLAYLFLMHETPLLQGSRLTVLHVAPEPNLSRVLSAPRNLSYFTCDRFAPKVMVTLDLTRMPFKEAAFDVVICNHVLEHVSDDRLAMTEIYRVLKTGGWALVQVPIALALDDSLEDCSATTDADRIRLFGQRDHVRLYAREDYVRRLSKANFRVIVTDYPRTLGPEATKYALIPEESVFVACKD